MVLLENWKSYYDFGSWERTVAVRRGDFETDENNKSNNAGGLDCYFSQTRKIFLFSDSKIWQRIAINFIKFFIIDNLDVDSIFSLSPSTLVISIRN